MKRLVGLCAVSVVLAPVLSGCSAGACPAVAYVAEVAVHTTGEFATLEACVAGDCVKSTDPASDVGLFTVTSTGDGEWTIGPFPPSPGAITLRARDAAGAEITSEAYDLTWTRNGGSEECGGPVTTPALDFAA